MKRDTVRAIIESNDDDLRTLARLAGGNPSSFYRGANFDDADLRGQDLRSFNLQAATFRRTRVDRYTRVDPQYFEDVGLDRKVKVNLLMFNVISEGLAESGIKLEYPYSEHLGDILEDALFSSRRIVKGINGIRLSLDVVKRGSSALVALSRRTGEIAIRQARSRKLDLTEFCTLVMISYLSIHARQWKVKQK